MKHLCANWNNFFTEVSILNPRYFTIIVVGLLLLSCNTDSTKSNENEIFHPTDKNKVPLKPLDFTITNERSGIWVDSTDLELVASIGISTGEKEYMIGRVTDLDFHHDKVILLDGQSNHLRSFNAKSGEFIQQFGRQGKGPGKLMYTDDLTVNDSLIFVSDRLFKTEIFKFTGSEYENHAQVSLDFSPSEICTIGDFLFLDGYSYQNNKKTVHKYNFITGEKIDSFHPPYKSDSQLAKMTLSENKIACNSTSETVIVASYYLPFFYGYDQEGNIKWASKLKQFNYRKAVESINDQGKPSMAKGVHRNGLNDFLSTFSSLGNSSYHVFQLMRRELKDAEITNSTILTYLMDTRDGSAQLISKSLPIIKAINGDIFLSYSLNNYYPEIKIYRYENEDLKNIYL